MLRMPFVSLQDRDSCSVGFFKYVTALYWPLYHDIPWKNKQILTCFLVVNNETSNECHLKEILTLSQSSPSGPRGSPLAKQSKDLAMSDPKWLRWGGQG